MVGHQRERRLTVARGVLHRRLRIVIVARVIVVSHSAMSTAPVAREEGIVLVFRGDTCESGVQSHCRDVVSMLYECPEEWKLTRHP
jgi:hypothetical protein